MNAKGAEPMASEIAKSLKTEEKKIISLQYFIQDCVSLDTPLKNADESTMVKDYLEAKLYKKPEDIVMHKMMKEELDRALLRLTKREKEIIQYRFGLNGESPRCLQYIGDLYHLTKESIRQIEKKTLDKLREIIGL